MKKRSYDILRKGVLCDQKVIRVEDLSDEDLESIRNAEVPVSEDQKQPKKKKQEDGYENS